ncbi:Protein YIPF [Fasciolopsis buskii]|uniref:Protein YIPF n=1 Tax=Fasciolopsis buskii TaxID=27845 RepID=A0A8E0S6U6_9TREM|nr:Protein YIPF [Fasciolopsis buski]
MLHRDSSDDSSGDGGPEFAQVFVIFWLGAALVTLNSKLLGGAVSFLQTVCVLGYCILPLVISLIVCRLLVFAGTKSLWLFIFRLAIVAFGLIYSSFASFVFLTPTQPPNRVGLTLYPVCLFYFFMSWLVISVPNQ